MNVRLPSQFGRYRILRPLGRGGMGSVFLAHDSVMDAKVAIKVPHPKSTRSQKTVERFHREARVMFGLRHPNLCPVHDVGEIDGHLYLVMAYINGEPLSKAIGTRGTFSDRAAAELVATIATALDFAHTKGIVHRDLKPENVMLEDDDVPVIMDFGLALDASSTASRLTRPGTVIGTPAYMPIEQVMGQTDQIGPRTDVYSLGVILYEMLCGRLPFEGGVTEVIGQIIGSETPTISEWNSKVDPELEFICMRAMAKQADDRFPGMREFAAALDAYCTQPSPRQKPTNGTATNPSSKPSFHSMVGRFPFVRTIAGVAALSFGLIAFLLLNRSPRQTDETMGEASRGSASKIHQERPKIESSADIPASIETIAPPELLKSPFEESTARASQKSWSEFLNEPTFVTNSIGITLVLIPPGEFLMGSPDSELNRGDDEPEHRVRITRPLYLGQHEVTVAQFRSFVNATHYKTEAERSEEAGNDLQNNWMSTSFEQSPDHPVVFVSWNDAVKFCEWLSRAGEMYRLPTEAEWEYACRAGTATAYNRGSNLEDLVTAANVGIIPARDEFEFTAPVGHFRANAFGLYDMHGNVHEWCSDWYQTEYYDMSPQSDPEGPEQGSRRVRRGGSWASISEKWFRSANRRGSTPAHREAGTGFRVVRVKCP